MSTSDSIPQHEASRSRQSRSETFDRNGRSIVVVKKARKDPGSLFSPSESEEAGSAVTPAGESEISGDKNDASVFRSWAMPESD